MKLRDPRVLAKLMAIQGVSYRRLAHEVGYPNHSVVRRLVTGQLHSVADDKAAKMAAVFDVAVDALFLSEPSTKTAHISHKKEAA